MVRSRALALGLVVLAGALGSGCAVGYVVVRPEPGPPAEGDRADWSAYTFAVRGAPGELSATRVLRQRHGVLDVRPAPGPAGAFTLEVETKVDSSVPPPLFLLSFLSFAAIPGWYEERTTWCFMLTAPDGETFDADAETSDRWVSWLPFLLFGPTLLASLNGGMVEATHEQRDAAEEVTARFLASAAAFVKAHGATPAVAK
ncbi:MAG TPA: hypothetical protein VFP50_02340 [Anaeromyxobacteraceae bacterium]|nr:hypothetical protein [Anaeromyxobacteraceae bacterium]